MSKSISLDPTVVLADAYSPRRESLPAGVCSQDQGIEPLTTKVDPYDQGQITKAIERLIELRWRPEQSYGGVKFPVIRRGDKVVIKPNLVFHQNQKTGEDLECLVTHAHTIAAVLKIVERSEPSSIVIGDAPIQSCNFERLLASHPYPELLREIDKSTSSARLVDFRCVLLKAAHGLSQRENSRRSEDDYRLVDLQGFSALEPVSLMADSFRVTMYDPRALKRTHTLGRHQYLVAKEILDADVVINMPKLKTHKKACLTGALKNLVGINGHKEYLPHHRKGGSGQGGDCYEGYSWFKNVAENLYDLANRHERVRGYILRNLAETAFRIGVVLGADSNLEGSWYGNDTVWRTCLDLNRILMYSDIQGVVQSREQREIVCVTDAVICGEGEGPLSPEPKLVGKMSLARNPAAADYVHAHIMGFNWEKIPVVREAFRQGPLPIAKFAPGDVSVVSQGIVEPGKIEVSKEPFRAPKGWINHC
jgi:uncharacterized protein (DUF362 family)